jgi:hypothetical protein
MEIGKEKIEELKKKYPQGVYMGGIAFEDAEGNARDIEFAFRKPAVADVETFAKTSQKSPVAANQNLLCSLVVFPDSAQVVAQLQDYPIAMGKFVEERITPFLGANVRHRIEKL